MSTCSILYEDISTSDKNGPRKAELNRSYIYPAAVILMRDCYPWGKRACFLPIRASWASLQLGCVPWHTWSGSPKRGSKRSAATAISYTCLSIQCSWHIANAKPGDSLQSTSNTASKFISNELSEPAPERRLSQNFWFSRRAPRHVSSFILFSSWSLSTDLVLWHYCCGGIFSG